MLIASLPAPYRESLVEKIISCPLVEGVRFNTGIVSNLSPLNTLRFFWEKCQTHHKRFWVDLKGRQLRIIQWAVPTYGDIILNHNISCDLPATVYLRGDDISEVVAIDGNHLFIDPPPLSPVGRGQAINISGSNLNIDGYLTEEDVAYIEAAKTLGINDLMLSFVEGDNDLDEVWNYHSKANLVLKIESLKGLEFINSPFDFLGLNLRLMAARDDLYVNIGDNKSRIFQALSDIISKDGDAILASKVLTSFDALGNPSLGSLADLHLMRQLGYQTFMLSDGVSEREVAFDRSIKAWSDYWQLLGN